MARTVTRLYDNRNDALEAAHELERMGIRADDVSIIASNKDSWYDGDSARKDKDGDGRDDRGEGLAKGAATGGVLGAGAGLLAGLGLIAIPGIGPVVAAGWLTTTLAGAATGAVAGGAVGGLVGALTDAGVPEEDAHVYSEGVRRGSTLLTVRVSEDRAADIEAALDRYRPSDVRTRGQEYRNNGWTRFDPDAPPPM
ncbi:hypothetical protein [Terricaulis sp.]|uniref:hypothetical protein n=1 Tax=Terricaulis sp. TaxID=2768686 RepID=UPI0037837FF6